MTYAQMTQEYKAKVKSYPYPLPTGISFPAAPQKPDEDTVYQKGEGDNTADSFWICAWMGEWLKTQGKDKTQADIAMGWVDRADDTELHQEHYSDPGHVWDNDIVGKAKLGDITNFADYYRNDCSTREGLGPIG